MREYPSIQSAPRHTHISRSDGPIGQLTPLCDVVGRKVSSDRGPFRRNNKAASESRSTGFARTEWSAGPRFRWELDGILAVAIDIKLRGKYHERHHSPG